MANKGKDYSKFNVVALEKVILVYDENPSYLVFGRDRKKWKELGKAENLDLVFEIIKNDSANRLIEVYSGLDYNSTRAYIAGKFATDDVVQRALNDREWAYLDDLLKNL